MGGSTRQNHFSEMLPVRSEVGIRIVTRRAK